MMRKRNREQFSPRTRLAYLTVPKMRILIFGALIVCGFGLILARLYLEQVCSGEEYREEISRQSVRRIRIPSRRGKIFSSDYKLLAGNSSECNLLFYPEEMREGGRRSKTIQYIFDAATAVTEAAGRPMTLTKKDIERHLNYRPGLPLVVLRRLAPDELARALESARQFRGIDIETDQTRIYPEGTLASQLIGYAQSENPKQARDRGDFFYYVPDLAGRSGLELAFDRLPESGESADAPLGLRGLPGYSLVLVDHLGYIRQNLIEKIEPRHGNNLVLTIDSRAQELAEQMLRGVRGAFVLLDAANGDVLAAASAPGYDLGEFTPFIRADYYRELMKNPDRPMINRVLWAYTPGSILKPLVALAFLNNGISPDDRTLCDGASEIGNARIRCAAWRSGGHGSLDLCGALAHSCNDYMIEHSQVVGFEPILEVLESAGIGRKTGLEIAERSGVKPDSDYKKRLYGSAWNRYDTALLSMGQGIITVTPIQAAVFTAALANGGTVWKPHLVRAVVDGAGNSLRERQPEVVSRLKTSPEALKVVQKGMHDVVNTYDGSGREARVPGLEIHGKTGSAEVGSRDDMHLITWFIFFVTYDNRTYAGCVMVEEGRSGGRSCAPLAAEFLRRYLLKEE